MFFLVRKRFWFFFKFTTQELRKLKHYKIQNKGSKIMAETFIDLCNKNFF